MPFTYIVECADGSYDVGSTWDLDRRTSQHNRGEGTDDTRRRRPVRLVWYQQSGTIKDAWSREKQIQDWSRAKKRALVEGRIPDLELLARGTDRGPAWYSGLSTSDPGSRLRSTSRVRCRGRSRSGRRAR